MSQIDQLTIKDDQTHKFNPVFFITLHYTNIQKQVAYQSQQRNYKPYKSASDPFYTHLGHLGNTKPIKSKSSKAVEDNKRKGDRKQNQIWRQMDNNRKELQQSGISGKRSHNCNISFHKRKNNISLYSRRFIFEN